MAATPLPGVPRICVSFGIGPRGHGVGQLVTDIYDVMTVLQEIDFMLTNIIGIPRRQVISSLLSTGSDREESASIAPGRKRQKTSPVAHAPSGGKSDSGQKKPREMNLSPGKRGGRRRCCETLPKLRASEVCTAGNGPSYHRSSAPIIPLGITTMPSRIT